MDPTATLKEIREIITQWENSGQRLDDEEAEDALLLFQNLDVWLTRGGFLPEQWKEKRDAAKGKTE